MKFYRGIVSVNVEFDIVVEAEEEGEAQALLYDEAKKRVRSPMSFDSEVFDVRESDEK